MDSTCLLMSKSDSSPDDGQYVPSTVKIIELPQMIDGTGRLWSKSYSSADDGEYVPSQFKIK